MFKKSRPAPKSTTYAFAAPNTAQSSSAQLRQSEAHTFYHPLPTPSPINNNNNNSPTTSPFGDEYSRASSPTPSNPLLAGQSPVDPGRGFERQMAPGGATSRAYGPRAAGMPARGESQNGLLADGARSNARRYGPTASNAPIGPNAALLGNGGSPNTSSVSDKQAFAPDPNGWGVDAPEADDYLHNPDPRRDRKNDHGGSIFTVRGLTNIGCLGLLLVCLITLFAGYPIISHYTGHKIKTNGAYNLGGINSTGQVPQISNFPSVIDPDTPSDKMSRTGFDGEQYTLVFSDEFNKDGRTFYEGDDPFWTGVDLHYWPTGDFEWYDPSAITTKDGNLVITMTQEPIHDLNFKSGMLQSWNQMCFQYSVYIEVSVSLPGTPSVGGFWPGVWMMGNLGRPGYGATTEGTWPYTYDSCDLGTLKNQTDPAGDGPEAALTTGSGGGSLSYLPGQRMSACTCKGEDHAGPDVSHGRGVPEIDIIEAQTDLSIPRGQVSQSAQVAPFDDYYQFDNASTSVTQYDTSLTKWNSYQGGVYQQAVSSLTYIDTANYQLEGGGFGVYGFEYYANPNDRGAGHITWVASGQKSWTMQASAVGPNSRVQLGQRLISEEPMAMVINFGMSNNFQTVNFRQLQWPAVMLVDYVRVYQRSDGVMGCDPADHPTADYIANHRNAYDNANYTTWADAGYTFPKNSLIDTC